MGVGPSAPVNLLNNSEPGVQGKVVAVAVIFFFFWGHSVKIRLILRRGGGYHISSSLSQRFTYFINRGCGYKFSKMEWLSFMWNIIWRTSKKHFIISPQYCPQKGTKLDQIVIKTWREITLYQSSEYWWLSQFWRGLGLVTSLQKASRWSQNFTRTTDLHFQKGWLCKKKNPSGFAFYKTL